jgi:hypothetical protein
MKTKETLRDCPDCGTKPGTEHKGNCDVERCSNCGGQRLGCKCPLSKHDSAFARWSGLWPGSAEASALGLDMNGLYSTGAYKAIFIKP